MAEQKNCTSCAYFASAPLLIPKASAQGMCHRHPPSSVPVGMNGQQVVTISCYPIVDKTHWCGEHKPKILDS